jgi:hypothetical protein
MRAESLTGGAIAPTAGCLVDMDRRLAFIAQTHVLIDGL